MKKQLGILALAVLAGGIQARGADNAYVQTNLVANDASFNPQIIDPNLVNAWGIALRPPGAGGHIWINDNRGGSSLVPGNSVEYIGDVNGIPLHQDGLQVVQLDTPAFTDKGYASVTGLAYNAASDLPGQVLEFPVAGPAFDYSTGVPVAIPGGTSGSAKFMFVTKDGTINAWRANTAVAMTIAVLAVDYSKTSTFPFPQNSVFTGVAMTTHPVTSADPALGNRLFATDFRNNAIEVFDNQWTDITPSVHFATPATVGDLHPFNVSDIGGHLFVAYAAWNPDADEGFEDTPGFGHLVEYNEDGSLAMDFNSGPLNIDDGGLLNSPWGVAVAPATFGAMGGDVLVANFADGTIAAFNPATGSFVDFLRDSKGDVVSVDGIWGLTFGNGVSLGDANSLYFTAGPNLEQDGLFGKLTVAPEPGSLAALGLGVLALFCLRRTRTAATGRA